ncbi:MAG: exodeoxyribonuclease III [Elusimicrobia bacterium]|nr:MAG: exodeoxyribonuclease III [Elusimicrobiota bacterium]
MRIATWNVNSLKVRLPQLLDWLAASSVDVVCLQETKLTDDKFPVAALAEAGYASAFCGQPTYNGVAILTRRDTVGEPQQVVLGNPLLDDPQKRLISASVAGVRVVCAYFPNGQAVDSDKYRYKLDWIDRLLQWLQPQMTGAEPLVLLGDYNIAPEDRDVHDPAAWAGQVLCSEPERARFRALQALGLVDAYRLFEQPERAFSWWDYRQMAFRRNMGLRIDHVLVHPGLVGRVRACTIDREMRKREQPSDHAPVVAELD